MRAVWTDRDLHRTGYKKPMSRHDPWVAASRIEELDRLKVQYGREDLLRALCRAHMPILAAHERAGRQVKWLF